MINQNQLQIFLFSTFCILIFLFFFYLIGYAWIWIIKKGKRDYSNSIFKTILYGIIVAQFVYVLFKSAFPLNTISLSIAPIIIFLFERLQAKQVTLNGSGNNADTDANSKLSIFSKRFYHTLYILIPSLAFLLVNFYFHFHGNYVNTGYGDQGWYHSVAKSLQSSGIESTNIHLDLDKMAPGFIYHYWDLWLQAFFYDTFSILPASIFSLINDFEISALIYQPLLVIIIFLGLIELASKIAKTFKIHSVHFSIVILLAFAGISHGFAEFGIVHHPKQFIISALFLFFCCEILLSDKDEKTYLLFSPLLLFYYPLPGVAMIATLILFYFYKQGIIKFFRPAFILTLLISLFCLVGIFYYLYFVYGVTCYSNLNSVYKSEPWNIIGVVRRFFIYHIYHLIVSPAGVLIIVNIFLLLGGFFNRIFPWINIPSINIKITWLLALALLNILMGRIISSVLYTAPEEFQFYNNDYFSFSVLFLVDAVFIVTVLKSIIRLNQLAYSFVLVLVTSLLLYNIYFKRPPYYSSVTLDYASYLNLKKLVSETCIQTFNSADIPFATEDIIFSFFNSRRYYNHDNCRRNGLENPGNHKIAGCLNVLIAPLNVQNLNDKGGYPIQILGLPRSLTLGL